MTDTTSRVPQRHGQTRHPTAAAGTVRVVALSLVMAILGVLLTLDSDRWAAPIAPLTLPWWAFVPAAVLSSLFVVHLEIRNEAHTFTLSELPLVVGLFFAAPWAVIVGRLAGEGLLLLTQYRRSGMKRAFNLCLFLLESSIAVVVFRGLSHGNPPTDRGTWLVVVLAIAAADVAGMAAVSLAIRWHGGRPRPTVIATASAVMGVTNCSLALVASVLLWLDPFALIPLGVVAVSMAVAYRSYGTLRQRYSGLQIFHDFTQVIGASSRAETVMDSVLEQARTLLRADYAEVVLFDQGEDRPALRRHAGEARDQLQETGEAAELAVWSRLVSGGRAIVIPRSGRSDFPAKIRAELCIRDGIITPLRSEGVTIGALLVANRLGDVSTFDAPDGRLFEMLGNHASVAFDNGRLIEQLRREAEERRYEALHDALTGLPNRSLFVERVERLTANNAPTAVLLMDLDRFKEVNDTLGHHHGDMLLCQVANRLREVVRPTDLVARLGGDEFVVLLTDLNDAARAHETASLLLEALRAPFVIGDLSLEVGASVGIALAPDHGNDATTLLQRADVALYDAKSERGSIALYCAERDTTSPRRLALAAELRHALLAGDVLVYYQPKARLDDEAVIGVEALVRWRHPEHGFLSPDEFIPVAEHTGLISMLTMHVLRTAVQQAAAWLAAGHDIGVAVNLSVRDLLNPQLPAVVRDLLTELRLPADRLTLEVTESGVMVDPARAITVLEELAAAGIRLSVDDFGTGYSSLAYLQRLPVHEVKVDRSFVFRMGTDRNDAVIVQSIVELGHNLGLTVVAEGVENRISWDRLKAMSCDIAQGYFLSKPVPATEITTWLDLRAEASAGTVEMNALTAHV